MWFVSGNVVGDFYIFFAGALINNVIFFAEINRKVYRSCRHVPPSSGDGEYSIDPTLSGNPFTVFCDMTTDGGMPKQRNIEMSKSQLVNSWKKIGNVSFKISNTQESVSSYFQTPTPGVLLSHSMI